MLCPKLRNAGTVYRQKQRRNNLSAKADRVWNLQIKISVRGFKIVAQMLCPLFIRAAMSSWSSDRYHDIGSRGNIVKF